MYQNCRNFIRRARGPWLPVYGWPLAVVLMIGLRATSANAEPMTFQLEATVTGVAGSHDVDFQLPFKVVHGDLIRGTFTLDTASLMAGTNPQLHRLQFAVGNTKLVTNRFLATVNATFLNPPPVAAAYSSVRLSRYEPTDVFPPGSENRVPGAEHILWDASLVLIGPDGLLTDPMTLENPLQWNELNLVRELTLDFTTISHAVADDNVRIRVQATVGAVSTIPEPGSMVLLGSGLLVGFGLWRLRLVRFHRGAIDPPSHCRVHNDYMSLGLADFRVFAAGVVEKCL